MIKRSFLFLSLAFLILSGTSCLNSGDCKDKTVASEDLAMQTYASNNGMIVAHHSSGMYYQILVAGSGATPTSSSQVSVKYTGKLLDGTIFDQKLTPTTLYPLAGFIPGWQLGLPLIQKGGKIQLIVPSSLAYGCKDSGPIPGNSILFFEIELVDVQ